MKTVALTLTAFLITFSTINAQEAVVSGSIQNSSYDSIYFRNAVQNSIIAGQALDDDTFRFTHELKQSNIYSLWLEKGKAFFVVLHPGDKVEVNLRADNLSASHVKGSEPTRDYYTTQQYMARMNARRDSVMKHYNQKKISTARTFVQENDQSLAAIFYMDAIKDSYPETFIQTANSLYKKYPGHSLVKRYKSQARGLLDVQKGKKAPDIALPNPQGDTVRLSSLRGQVVLVDFWASWCGPCRKESPNLVKTYKRFKDDGFEIYSVSLDRSRENWLNAIEADNLDWTHVSDLNYWNSVVVDLYGFSGIPHTVLLDEKGRVIAKNLRGDDLGEKLEEVFSENTQAE